jgi:hypothetical protein
MKNMASYQPERPGWNLEYLLYFRVVFLFILPKKFKTKLLVRNG